MLHTTRRQAAHCNAVPTHTSSCVCVSLECEYPHSFITYSPHSIPQPHPTTKCPIPPASLLMEPVSPSPTAGQHFVPCPFPLFPFPFFPCPLSPITIGERRLGPCDQRTNCCDLTASFSDIFANFLFFKGALRFAFLWLWLWFWLCF